MRICHLFLKKPVFFYCGFFAFFVKKFRKHKNLKKLKKVEKNWKNENSEFFQIFSNFPQSSFKSSNSVCIFIPKSQNIVLRSNRVRPSADPSVRAFLL